MSQLFDRRLNIVSAASSRRTGLRAAIVVVVLLLSLVPAIGNAYLFAVIGLGGLVVYGAVKLLLRWPPLGLVALIVAALLIPFSVSLGGTELNITTFLTPFLLGVWFLWMLHQKDWRLAAPQLVYPLAAFLLAATISLVLGQLPWFPFIEQAPITAQIGGLGVFVLSFGVFLLVGNAVRDIRWLKAMTWLFIAIGAGMTFTLVIPGASAALLSWIPDGTAGAVLWVWLVAIAFSQAVTNKKINIFARIFLISLILGIFYVHLFQGRGWVSGWAPGLVSILIIVWLAKPRFGWLMSVLGATVFVLNSDSILKIIYDRNEYSLLTRVEAWRIVIEIAGVNPLFGLGPANYYWYTPYYSILGFNVNFSSHNNYVDILAQVGVLGLIFFLWFVVATGRFGLRLRSRVPSGSFSHAYILGALGALGGSMVAGMFGDWVLPFVYNVGLKGLRASLMGWMLLGGMVAIHQILKNSRSGNDPLDEREQLAGS